MKRTKLEAEEAHPYFPQVYKGAEKTKCTSTPCFFDLNILSKFTFCCQFRYAAFLSPQIPVVNREQGLQDNSDFI